MLATLNSKQIVDEIVKDASNDPHDLLDILGRCHSRLAP